MEDEDGWVTLPKVELHAHLGGSSNPKTLLALLTDRYGQEKGAKLASDVLIPRCADGIPCEPEGYRGFAVIKDAYNSTSLIEKLLIDYLDDCASDGIAYVEVRTGGENVDKLDTILAVINKRELSETLPICRLIVSIKREGSTSDAWTTVRNAVAMRRRWGNLVVAVDFCGVNTCEFPFTQEHMEAVKYAKGEGLLFVPHFAEAVGEKDLKDILDSGPHRLGHAVWMDPHSKERVFNEK